jgi:hypothetical protein
MTRLFRVGRILVRRYSSQRLWGLQYGREPAYPLLGPCRVPKQGFPRAVRSISEVPRRLAIITDTIVLPAAFRW